MTRRQPRAEIASIEPGSIAEELGLLPGDVVLRVNGETMLDVLDFQQRVAAQHVRLEVARGDDVWECDIEKDEEESLGIAFTNVVFDGVRRCRNRCVFCFVDNLPKGLRPSLYLKDDDYRLSFLHGNFITLDNLSEGDWKRILRLRLSPLYVSVHATDPEVRSRLVGRAGDEPILPKLERLTGAGIEVHAQVVLCPGINDRRVLNATVRDLAELHPGVASVGVVPVGLTRFVHADAAVRAVGADDARRALAQIHALQREFLGGGNGRDESRPYMGHGCSVGARLIAPAARFVFAADELYLRAKQPIPAADEYEDFPQLSNGVGLIASFRNEEDEALEAVAGRESAYRRVTLVTGVDAALTLVAFGRRLARLAGIEVNVLAVQNEFFGQSVTVAGLLTGQDICDALGKQDVGDAVLVPEVALRDGEVFLDEMTTDDLRGCTRATVQAVPAVPRGIVDALMEPRT